jgi:hypothetical protein
MGRECSTHGEEDEEEEEEEEVEEKNACKILVGKLE